MMGMYTELFLQVTLKKDIPNEILNTLRYMVGEEVNAPDVPPFDGERWEFMLQSSSYYHYPKAHSFVDDPGFEGDSYRLFVRCDLKNYDDEIKKFLDWLTPYVECDYGNYEGHYMYEEDEEPTRIRFLDGKVKFG